MVAVYLKYLLILILFYPSAVIASSDPFMGEGKQTYIERCISKSDMPGYSAAYKSEFCKCFANKLEKGYQVALESIRPSDSVTVAQQKMDNMAQQFARECTDK